jgi:fluoroquinolone transport system permease protein
MPAARLRRQLRMVPPLLVPTARTIRWLPALAAFAVSLGLLALAVRPGRPLPPEQLVLWLRRIIIAAALGYAFLLDDPSKPTTESVAVSLLLRRTMRVVLLLPATATWWIAVTWRVHAVHPQVAQPITALTLEAAALITVAIALAAAGSHLAPERRGSVVAAPALLTLATAAFLLPARFALYAPPGSTEWDGAHQRWTALLGLALAAYVLTSRDPAHRRGLRPLRTHGRERASPPATPRSTT